MEAVLETDLKAGDRMMITRDYHWSSVAKAKRTRAKNADLVPAGAAGKLYVIGGMWDVRFDHYRNHEEWPCLIGFHLAKLPLWIVKQGGEVKNIPAPEALSGSRVNPSEVGLSQEGGYSALPLSSV